MNGANTPSTTSTAIHAAPNRADACPNVSYSACASSERGRVGCSGSGAADGRYACADSPASAAASALLNCGPPPPPPPPTEALLIAHPRVRDDVEDVRQQIANQLQDQDHHRHAQKQLLVLRLERVDH